MSNDTTTMTTFYPGSYTGFTAAGSFFLLWGLGHVAGLMLRMNVSSKKFLENKLLCGIKWPVEGLWLAILGICAFFGQLGQANWKFYDAEYDFYMNQNNLRDAFFFLGLGLAGVVMILTAPLRIAKHYQRMLLIVPFTTYIISLCFKARQTMTDLDYTIFVVQILLFGAIVVALIAECVTVAAHPYVSFVRSMMYVFLGIWYLQTANFYWGKHDNTMQDRTFANEYVLNIFTVEVLLVGWVIGLVFFYFTRHYEHEDVKMVAGGRKVVIDEAEKSTSEQAKFTPHEQELSMENMEGNLLKP